MWQRVSVGVPNHFRGIGVAGEIAFPCRITPLALGIPMPSLHEKFSVLPIADGAPTSRQNLFDCFWFEKRIGGVAGNAIYRRAQRVKRTEGIHHMARCGVHADGLRGQPSW